jgi:hypothetical protein
MKTVITLSVLLSFDPGTSLPPLGMRFLPDSFALTMLERREGGSPNSHEVLLPGAETTCRVWSLTTEVGSALHAGRDRGNRGNSDPERARLPAGRNCAGEP